MSASSASITVVPPLLKAMYFTCEGMPIPSNVLFSVKLQPVSANTKHKPKIAKIFS